MPNPFPGMDPYLESPALWRGVHSRFINDLADELNRALPRGYAADIDERLYLVEPARPVYPDPSVRRSDSPVVKQGRANTATLAPDTATASWRVVAPEPEEVSEAYVKVLSLGAETRVVAVIEVLSPSNKTPGHAGQDSYLLKQRELHASGIALLELDLLRGGAHTVAAPRKALEQFGTWDYLACLHRAGQREWEVWPILLWEPLPTIRVPLSEAHPDVLLPLQTPLTRTYDRGRYAERINYQLEPEPPLKLEDAAKARELLRALLEAGEVTGSLVSG